MTLGRCSQAEGVGTDFGVAPPLTCAARLAMIATDLAPVARIASLLLWLTLPAQGLFDLISVHKCCTCKTRMQLGIRPGDVMESLPILFRSKPTQMCT
jgi:hypothetical protein